MEYDLSIRQHDQFVQLAQGHASASEALATSMGADETAISPPAASELLTNLMNTIMTLRQMTDALRSRLVASLYRTGIGLAHVDLVTGETREASVLAADADIFGSASSLEFGREMFEQSTKRHHGAGIYEDATGNLLATSRTTPCTTTN